MQDSFEGAFSAPVQVKVAFLQGLFEYSGVIDKQAKCVRIPIQASYLNQLVRMLKEVGASPHIVGTEPVTVEIGVEEAARIPLFNPVTPSRKYQDATSLAAVVSE